MPFNTIADNFGRGYPGQIAEPLAPKYAVSRVLTAAGSAGRVMVRGTDAGNQECRPLFTGDAVTPALVLGVALLSTSRPFEDGSPYKIGSTVSVMRQGVVYLEFVNAPISGHMVGCTLATGVLTSIAQGTAAGAIAAGIVIVPGLRVAQTGPSGGIAAVEVNLFGSQDLVTVGTL